MARAGVALHLPHLPSSAHAWRAAVTRAMDGHDPAAQARLVTPDPANDTARWLETLARDLWSAAPPTRIPEGAPA
ncbi:hypothetical protein [Paracoccus sp. PAMC 22219]|uniref:hypothetical protein n=1 Tax=Paracoccus sp. PAMC 22219 TaxID=1569209 RepID=UPI001E2E6066|nr:hypothetical protein [Paracoccus sp. PAMC 22219]